MTPRQDQHWVNSSSPGTSRKRVVNGFHSSYVWRINNQLGCFTKSLTIDALELVRNKRILLLSPLMDWPFPYLPDRRWHIALLSAIIAGSLCLNLYNIHFQLGYHADEPKKVFFVQRDVQDFHHPILLLQITRLTNLFWGLSDGQQIAILGRTVSAVSGALVVFVSYGLALQLGSRQSAILAAFLVSISPILVIHAHYFKEDVLFTFCALAALYAFNQLIREAKITSLLLFGLATGLACSAHYKSGLLVATILMAPLYSPAARDRKKLAYTGFGLVIAGFIAAIVNYPVFENWHTFVHGIRHELEHISTGHTIRYGPFDYYLGFHFLYSLVPGMSVPIAVAGVAGALARICRWTKTSPAERPLLMFTLLNYIVPELAPSKPAPDFARYILPAVPLLLLFAAMLVHDIHSRLRRPYLRSAFTILVGIIAFGSLYRTVLLDFHLIRDTREIAADWIAANTPRPIYEHHSRHSLSKPADVRNVGEFDLVANTQGRAFTHYVASSFAYGRIMRGSELPNQAPYIYRTRREYERLFSLPYIEIQPSYMSYAFSNPTIRIVDLRDQGTADN